MNLPFALPPNRDGLTPKWLGDKFQIGNETTQVLEYSLNDKGWKDELTFLHEEAASEHHFIDEASRDHALSQVIKYAKNNSIILEVGCSSGYMLQRLMTTFPHGLIIGADVVKEPLEQLAKKIPTVPLFRFDLTECPLPDNSVDIIVILNVLEHIENDEIAIDHLYRILKPNGVVIIEVPAGPNLYDEYDKFLMHFRRYQLSKLVTMIKRKKFSPIKKSHLGFFLYPGFWLVKKYNRINSAKFELNQSNQVESNIKQTGKSRLMRLAMRLELTLGRIISYPFGIRCLVTCKKT